MLPLALALCLSDLSILVLVEVSRWKLEKGMPSLGSRSMAISAACANCAEGGEASTKPLMYGVLTTGATEGLQRVGFSQHKVMPLQEGTKYL